MTDLTEIALSHRGFYIQAFHESVSFLVTGYHYDSHWTVLSVGLSPTGMSASFAALEPDVRNDRIRLSEKVSRGRPRETARPCDKADEAEPLVQDGSGKSPESRTHHLVLGTQPLT